MADGPCPSRDELVNYLANKLAEDAASRIKTHLDACAECRDVMKTLAVPHRPPDMSMVDASALETLGEYQIVEKLGSGGMGTVYKARHTELERMVALKVLSEELVRDDRAVARFRREMKAVGRFDHPNIVRAYDAREIDGTYFLVMEYVDGLDLAELVARTGPLPIADACELVRKAACGLQCAEEHGMVHRDIKPSNLILAEDGQLKILDLGLARIHTVEPADEAMTAVGQLMGTPDYMAPEQVDDSHAVDIRADVYSLGCTLYMLLAGHPPFIGTQYGTAFGKMVAHTRDPIPPIRQIRPEVPEQLAAIMEQMLAKSPDKRSDTPGRVADMLEPFTADADPIALLAKARRSGRVDMDARIASQGTDAGGSATTAPTQDYPVQTTERSVRPRFRRPVVLAAVVFSVLALVAVVLIITSRRSNELQEDPDVIANVEKGDTFVAEDDKARTKPENKQKGENRQSALAVVDPAELPGWIVMSWTRRGLGMPSLWLISLDGRRHVPVTRSRGALDVQPCFSPDGRRIAFIRGRGPKGPTSVWTCDVDGSNERELVAPRHNDERLISPIWISNSRILYTCDPRPDSSVEMEVWQVDLEDKKPQRLFDFDRQSERGGSLVTDVSPDRKQLAVVAQTRGINPSSKVYLVDLDGTPAHTLWTDSEGICKNTRAIWSPDGRQIAWCHYFTIDSSGPDLRYGVGLAQLGINDQWTAKLQPQENLQTTPLAWSPDGRYLLCGRIDQIDSVLVPATLCLMDDKLQLIGELFELKMTTWGAKSRDFGRLADWAEIPKDALPEPLHR
ncbi:MAG: protein kinase [Pirellulales bacterium]|nr:protein kinase [Pirellulales bacterium]